MKFGKLLGLIGIIGLLYLFWQVRQLLLLLYAAIAFATVINQLVRQVQKLSVSRGWAVALTLFIIGGLLSAAAWFVVPTLIAQIPAYASLSELGIDRIQGWYQELIGIVPGDALAKTNSVTYCRS
ncbi:MAG: AI-2E family transporter [Cyanobacteria bacterium J06650_10]